MKLLLYMFWAMAWMVSTSFAVVNASEKGGGEGFVVLIFCLFLGSLSALGVDTLAKDFNL